MKLDNIRNKRVIVRVDYNVPLKNSKILDDTKIIRSIKTIKVLLDNDNAVILMSHLGKVKTLNDKKSNTLLPVYKYLKEIFNYVNFSYVTSGDEFEKKIKMLRKGQVLLVENTRYEDLVNNRESSCSPALAKYWASKADVYVFDAFGSIHRNHASTFGISYVLPSYMGYLVKEEMDNLNRIFKIKNKILILGGAKVESKISVIENLVKSCDKVLIGGLMCFTFLKAKGYNTGKNFVDNEKIDYAKKMLDKYGSKIILPSDFNVKDKNVLLEDLKEKDVCFDIGKNSIKEFEKYIKGNTIVWNGPLGYAEKEKYALSTISMCNKINDENCFAYILGGDSISIIKKIGINKAYYSTGGGASLEYLSGSKFKILKQLKK